MTKRIDEEIRSCRDPFVREAIEIADDVLGIGKHSAEDIIAEIGVQMNVFPTARHISSWAGMCPGNNESAGKRKSGKTSKGSPYLRRALVQAAWAASHTKTTYLSAQYTRLRQTNGQEEGTHCCWPLDPSHPLPYAFKERALPRFWRSLF